MDAVRPLELTGLLLGALDPSRARMVAAEVAASPTLQAELRALEDAMSARQAVAPSTLWRIPGPTVLMPGLSARVSVTPTLDAARPGEVCRIQIAGIPEPDARAVVVLRRDPNLGWKPVFPLEREDWMRASALRGADGEHVLMITVGAEPGPQRWAVVFPPLDLEPDWDAPGSARWAVIQALFAQGGLPCVSWDVDVAARDEDRR